MEKRFLLYFKPASCFQSILETWDMVLIIGLSYGFSSKDVSLHISMTSDQFYVGRKI